MLDFSTPFNFVYGTGSRIPKQKTSSRDSRIKNIWLRLKEKTEFCRGSTEKIVGRWIFYILKMRALKKKNRIQQK